VGSGATTGKLEEKRPTARSPATSTLPIWCFLPCRAAGSL